MGDQGANELFPVNPTVLLFVQKYRDVWLFHYELFDIEGVL
jgi:hypothetical protein